LTLFLNSPRPQTSSDIKKTPHYIHRRGDDLLKVKSNMELLVVYLVILTAMLISYKMGYHAGKIDAAIDRIHSDKSQTYN
tara:strand:+ start:1204 stop:1443 length:240 start_codon:yes stop_codon:yes gene_type:complete